MNSRSRSRLIVGGLALVALVLLIVIFLNRAGPAAPAVVNSPVTINSAAAEAATPTAVVVANQATSPLTAASAALSPLAAPQAATVLTTTAITITTDVSAAGRGGGAADNQIVITADISATAPLRRAGEITPTAELTAAVSLTTTDAVTTSAEVTVAQATENGIPLWGYEVVATYPHDPTAFTQGLQYVDGLLYEGTGLYGESSLRRVDLESGTVEEIVPLAEDYFGEGIVVVDERIYQLTWQSNIGFIYDRESLEPVDEFRYDTEGWGITYDGEALIISDGTSTLYRRDPTTLDETGRIQVRANNDPVIMLNELEVVEGEVFANIWQTDRIARIDPATGQVIGWIDLAGLLDPATLSQPADVLNGIAYDDENDRLFVTGKFWPTLFEIDLVPR